MTNGQSTSFYPLLVFVVVSIAVVGYFVGLQSPMNPAERANVLGNRPLPLPAINEADGKGEDVILAPYYSELGQLRWGANKDWRTNIAMLPTPPKTFDPDTEITIAPEQRA